VQMGNNRKIHGNCIFKFCIMQKGTPKGGFFFWLWGWGEDNSLEWDNILYNI